MLGRVRTEDLHGALHPGPGGDGGPGRAAEVGVVEVRQPVRGGPDLAAHAALLPGQHAVVGPEPGQHGPDVVAVAAGARVQRAMEILGADAPEHLLSAGRLRMQHPQVSLEDLGLLADPPMTKDAVAGRVRRLLALADRRAAEIGIPDTEASVTPEMLTS